MLRFFLCICLVLHLQSAFALNNGNPSAPIMPEKGVFSSSAWLTLKGGYEFDETFQRILKIHKPLPDEKRTIKNTELTSQFGVVTLNFADRVEIYSTLGNMHAKFVQHPFSGVSIHYDTDTEFAWSIGGRTLFAYWGDFQFGLDAAYLQFSPSFKSIKVGGISYPKGNAMLHYREWQIGAAISYHYWFLFPYAGAKYSDIRAKFLNLDSLEFYFPNERFYAKNKKTIGLILGCGFALDRAFGLNVEGHLIDETALTVSANIKF